MLLKTYLPLIYLSSNLWIHDQKETEELVFLFGIHSMQSYTVTKRHKVTRKTKTKRLKDTGNLFRKNPQLKDVS